MTTNNSMKSSANCSFLLYQRNKQVVINNYCLGAVYRALQAILLFLIPIWVFVINKGCYDYDTAIGTVLTKVKGIEFTDHHGQMATKYGRIWDTAAHVVPPMENGAFFVTTNAVVTKGQRQGLCDEDPSLAPCQSDADCPLGDLPTGAGNGMKTGRCVNSTQKLGHKSCQIMAWCPVESNNLPANSSMFPRVVNFTVFIKNDIVFPKFNKSTNNIVSESVDVRKCRYDAVLNPKCPVFRIGTILSEARIDFSDIAYRGGVILIVIKWSCQVEFSKDIFKCETVYSFERLDKASASAGLNFRHASYYEANGDEHRTLVKAYGIRFIVVFEGTASKFSLFVSIMNLGSAFGFFSTLAVLFEFFLLTSPWGNCAACLQCACPKGCKYCIECCKRLDEYNSGTFETLNAKGMQLLNQHPEEEKPVEQEIQFSERDTTVS